MRMKRICYWIARNFKTTEISTEYRFNAFTLKKTVNGLDKTVNGILEHIFRYIRNCQR